MCAGVDHMPGSIRIRLTPIRRASVAARSPSRQRRGAPARRGRFPVRPNGRSQAQSSQDEGNPGQADRDRETTERGFVSLLWIILIVILVLALLGFFTRGRW
jgi:hypothetical protein